MHIYAILNERAGSVLGQDHDAVAQMIEPAFTTRGHTLVLEFAAPQAITDKIKTAAANGTYDVILVGGGDGSVRSAAAVAIAEQFAIGILPLGTLNRLAREIGIPMKLQSAAEALAGGEIQRIDAASVNGQYYLSNSLLGLPSSYSEQRQKLRGQPFAARMHGYVSVLHTMLSSRKRLSIVIDDGAGARSMRALSVAVANNAYDEGLQVGLHRPALDGGKLGVYVSRHRSGWAMVKAMARAVFGFWRGDPYLQKFTADELVIRVHADKIRLSNDGEVETFATPLYYKIHPKVLQILVPTSVDQVQPQPSAQVEAANFSPIPVAARG